MNSSNIFSILIPTWNNLPFLKLCIGSIRKNSVFPHQILIYVNVGDDGTLEWVKEQGFEYVYSPKNVGICWALNSLRPLVKTDYILYLNDDMYVCPEWDKYLLEEIKALPDNKFFISATMIEPDTCSNGCTLGGHDYGRNPENFDEKKLLEEYATLPHHDWIGATWPPNVVHKDIWDSVGGYSIEFSPGMSSDPDFSAKLWMSGIRYFKGISNSRVYHFQRASTLKVKKNKGHLQFLMKYGITSSTFYRYLLKLGEPFSTSDSVKTDSKGLKRNLKRSRLKQLLLLGKNFMVLKLWE